MIQEGDLLHIPQGVEMWNESGKGMKMQITCKPITGVYMGGGRHIYHVYANGEWSVKRKDVYPLGANNGIS
jgi:hypothetical protein